MLLLSVAAATLERLFWPALRAQPGSPYLRRVSL